MTSVKTGLLLLSSLGSAFLIVEIGVRVHERTLACHRERPVPEGLYRRDPVYGHTLTPGYEGKLDGGCWETPVRVSREATRGAEIRAKTTGTHRILLIGDSYVFGLGVDEESSLPALLEEALRRDDAGVEVINAGVPGWTSVQAAILAEEEAARFEADRILVHVYLGNDLEERVKFEERGEEEEPPAGTAPARSWFRIPSSHLLHTVRRRWVEARYKWGSLRQPLRGPWFDIFLREGPDRVHTGFELLAEDLARIREFSQASGIPWSVVITPSWTQVTHPDAETACRAFICRQEEVDMRLPNRKLHAMLADNQVPYLDLTDRLVEAYGQGGYKWIIGHWDEAGTRLAAGWIAEWLRTTGFSDDPELP